MLLIVPFWGALLFTEAFSVKHYDDNSQDEHYEGSGRVRRSRGRGEDFGRERSDRTERSRPARIRPEAGTVAGLGANPRWTAPLCWRAFMLSPLV